MHWWHWWTCSPTWATSQLKYWTISEKSFKINVGKIKRWKESWIFDSEKKNFYKKSKCLECFAANWQKIEVKQQKGLWKKCLGQVQKNLLLLAASLKCGGSCNFKHLQKALFCQDNWVTFCRQTWSLGLISRGRGGNLVGLWSRDHEFDCCHSKESLVPKFV